MTEQQKKMCLVFFEFVEKKSSLIQSQRWAGELRLFYGFSFIPFQACVRSVQRNLHFFFFISTVFNVVANNTLKYGIFKSINYVRALFWMHSLTSKCKQMREIKELNEKFISMHRKL